MASPLPVRKQTVDLSKGKVRVSRIRRDPPPSPPKALTKAEVRVREAWVVGIGVTLFGLAMFVLLLAVNNWPRWSPAKAQLTLQAW